MTLDTSFSHGVHPQTSDAPHLCACPLWLAWTEPEGREPAELAEPAGGGEGRTSCPTQRRAPNTLQRQQTHNVRLPAFSESQTSAGHRGWKSACFRYLSA